MAEYPSFLMFFLYYTKAKRLKKSMAGVYWVLSTGNFYVVGMLTGSGNLLGGNYQKKMYRFFSLGPSNAFLELFE
ncbi:hypothetical protein DMO16_17995 [Fictibacillus sp. S7]|nr:hypothetical protein DMO16_17995 [Fictibacillus sp. S7]